MLEGRGRRVEADEKRLKNFPLGTPHIKTIYVKDSAARMVA